MQNHSWSDYAALPLRLILGAGFIIHGHPKLFDPAAHDAFVTSLQSIEVPAPEMMAWVVGVVEFFGGIALLLGAFTTIVSALGIFEMAVATVLVHLPMGFEAGNVIGMTEEGPVFGMPGYEVNLLYIAGFLALILGGAGVWSIDRMRARRAYVQERITPAEREAIIGSRRWSGSLR